MCWTLHEPAGAYRSWGLVVAAVLIFMIVRLLEGRGYLAESSVLVFVIVAGGVLLTYGAWKKDE
jgi:hypothetical protein